MIHVLWAHSPGKCHGGCEMGGRWSEPTSMWATSMSFWSWTTETIAPPFLYAIGFNRAMIPGIQTSKEIAMASLLRTSTAWMARCTPTRLRSLCIVNKYFSPTILQGRGGRLYVGQTSGANAINWNSTSPCRPLLKWEMMVSLRVCNHGWRM